MQQAFRRLSQEVAMTRVLRAISALGFDSRVEMVAASPSTAIASLLLGDILVAHGLGKGPPCDALTGAFFEALEHYSLDVASAETNSQLQFVSSISFASDPRLRVNRAIGLLAKASECHLAARKFYPITGKGNSILFPAFLTNPRQAAFEENLPDNIQRYSSNNGTAIGLSYEEAVLHGVNEVVERDLLSRMLASGSFMEPIVVGLIETDSLPDSIRLTYESAQRIVDRPLALMVISQSDELPTFLTISKSEGELPIWGAGTSIDPMHAILRAVNECAQSAHASRLRPDSQDVQAAHRRRLNGIPTLSNISSLGWSRIQKSTRQSLVTLDSLLKVGFPKESQGPIASVREALSSTLAVVERCYSGIYAATIANFPEEIVAVQVVIPEADSFFLTLSGVPLIPSYRHCREVNDALLNQ